MTGRTLSIGCALVFSLVSVAFGQENQSLTQDANGRIPHGAKVYIGPIEGGYDIYLAAAMQKKEVPIVLVTDPAKADFELSGVNESEKAGWAKVVFWGNTSSKEEASVKLVDLKAGRVVWGYNVNKGSSARGKQSSAEACAKHLKSKIEGGA
jgi:hypothetical protein